MAGSRFHPVGTPISRPLEVSNVPSTPPRISCPDKKYAMNRKTSKALMLLLGSSLSEIIKISKCSSDDLLPCRCS